LSEGFNIAQVQELEEVNLMTNEMTRARGNKNVYVAFTNTAFSSYKKSALTTPLLGGGYFPFFFFLFFSTMGKVPYKVGEHPPMQSRHDSTSRLSASTTHIPLAQRFDLEWLERCVGRKGPRIRKSLLHGVLILALGDICWARQSWARRGEGQWLSEKIFKQADKVEIGRES
jgi:hypothetical protein